jgi:hypothetical protein
VLFKSYEIGLGMTLSHFDDKFALATPDFEMNRIIVGE